MRFVYMILLFRCFLFKFTVLQYVFFIFKFILNEND